MMTYNRPLDQNIVIIQIGGTVAKRQRAVNGVQSAEESDERAGS